jgi:hypothetical protein
MFSLRTLLIAIAVAALGIAAIINRTPIWASAFVTLTFFLVLASALLAILRPGTRMFWTPVAIVGLSYTLIIYSDWCENLHYRLVTTQATIKVWEWLNREHRAPRIRRPIDDGEPTGREDFLDEVERRRALVDDPFADPPPASQLVGPAVLRNALDWRDSDMDPLGSYYWSAQSLWTLTLAFGSGLVSWHFLGPRSRKTSNPVPTPQSPS